GTGEAVRRIARTGGAGEIVAGGFGPGDLEALTIVDGTVVYATARELWRITATGPQLIAGGLDLSSELTGAAGLLYAGAGPRERISSVFRVPLAGGTPQPIATMLANPSGIAVDGDTVYFTDGWLQRVYQLPAAGGAVTVLVDGDRGSGGIVARGGRLYYARAFAAHARRSASWRPAASRSRSTAASASSVRSATAPACSGSTAIACSRGDHTRR